MPENAVKTTKTMFSLQWCVILSILLFSSTTGQALIEMQSVYDKATGQFTYSFTVDNTLGTFPIAAWTLEFSVTPDWNPLTVRSGGDVSVPNEAWFAIGGIPAEGGVAAQDFITFVATADVPVGETLSGFSFPSAIPLGTITYFEFGEEAFGDSATGTIEGPIANTVSVTTSRSSMTANGSSTATITATVKDLQGNPATNTIVTMAVTQGSGSVGSVTNNGNGMYTATYRAGTSSGTVVITATADNGNGVSGSVNLFLSSPNQAPQITQIGGKSPFEPHSVEAGSPLLLTVLASDSDGDTIQYSASSLPEGADFTPDTRQFSWTPQDDQVGDHTVFFTVSDGKTQSTVAVTITVLERLTVSISTPQETTVFLGLTVGVAGTITAASAVTINDVLATIEGDEFTGTATFTDFGVQTISVLASTTDGRQATATVSIRLVEDAINSVSVQGTPATVDDIITVTLMTEVPGTATFSIAGLPGATEIAMEETNANTFTGTHIVEAGQDVVDGVVTVTFTALSGAVFTDGNQTVRIDTTPPIISEVALDGQKIRNGQDFMIRAVAEVGAILIADVSQVDTTRNTLPLVAVDEGIYELTVTVSLANTAEDGVKTITITATDAIGNATSFDVTITLQQFNEFVLNIPDDISLVHIPLRVAVINNRTMSLGRISDLYDALGQENVNLIITYLSPTEHDSGRWSSYLGEQSRGLSADRVITPDLGIILVMRHPVTLHLEGEAWGTDGKSEMALNRGINLVGLPLDDERLRRISDLFGFEGIRDNVSVIVSQAPSDGAFKLVAQPGDEGDIDIIGGQSFILFAREAAVVEFTGKGWDNVSDSVFAAPPMPLIVRKVDGQTSVLEVHGAVIDELTERPQKFPTHV